MATLSILGYNLPQGFKMKANNENMHQIGAKIPNETNNLTCKTFNKITVQNVLSENSTNTLNISNNSANIIVRKIKDFGMCGTVAATKVTSNTTLSEKRRSPAEIKHNSENKFDSVTAKKIKFGKDATTPKSSRKVPRQNPNVLKPTLPNVHSVKPAGTPGRKGLPLPQAVARRNARERNRVKQVNNGFAALRERIPEEVAETFEAQGNGRGSAKKLSKVETLRMAVEYIRSLERLLGFDFPLTNSDGSYSYCSGQGSSSGEDSFILIKDEFDELSTGDNDHYDDSLSNYDMDEYFSPANTSASYDKIAGNQLEILPNITTLNGLQYIRIPGTNTYQLLTADLFANSTESIISRNTDEENVNALINNNCHSPATSATEAELQSSPPTIDTIPAITPASQVSGGACANATTLSLLSSSLQASSPVPQTITACNNASSQQQQEQPVALSPAVNDVLLRTCATNNLTAQSLFKTTKIIKQELTEKTVAAQSRSPHAANYQPPSLHRHDSAHTMSPPLDRLVMPQATNSPGLQAFYEQDQSASFYDGVVAFKKELNEVLLDTSAATAALSDESMIEAIDWWEAHTPNSDGGSVIL